MLTHLDSSKGPFAGEARRPTKRGPQFNCPAKGAIAGEARRPTRRGSRSAEAIKQRTSSTSSSSSWDNNTSHSNSICLTVRWHDMYVSHGHGQGQTCLPSLNTTSLNNHRRDVAVVVQTGKPCLWFTFITLGPSSPRGMANITTSRHESLSCGNSIAIIMEH